MSRRGDGYLIQELFAALDDVVEVVRGVSVHITLHNQADKSQK
tara:strand:- start:119 stop:247 length:129 start_codon:yes stop_codon:yes gene_type:complete